MLAGNLVGCFSGRKVKRMRWGFRHQSGSMTSKSNSPSPSPRARKNQNASPKLFSPRAFFSAKPRRENATVKRNRFPKKDGRQGVPLGCSFAQYGMLTNSLLNGIRVGAQTSRAGKIEIQYTLLQSWVILPYIGIHSLTLAGAIFHRRARLHASYRRGEYPACRNA